jgi:hypothetical protein
VPNREGGAQPIRPNSPDSDVGEPLSRLRFDMDISPPSPAAAPLVLLASAGGRDRCARTRARAEVLEGAHWGRLASTIGTIIQ